MRLRSLLTARLRLRQVAVSCVALLVLSPLTLYLILLGMEALSAHQASIALTRLENLRLGDPVSSFDRAVSSFQVETGSRVLTAGAYRLERPWDWLWLRNQQWGDELSYLFSRAGLRWWNLRASASAQNGKLTRISVGFMIVGRYEMQGTGWNLEAGHPSVWGRRTLTDLDRRTFLHWFAITSMPSGEGLGMEVTPESTPTELDARHINRKCLLTMHGCEGLCELLPRAVKVLRERGADWGGYTSVPPSSCKSED